MAEKLSLNTTISAVRSRVVEAFENGITEILDVAGKSAGAAIEIDKRLKVAIEERDVARKQLEEAMAKLRDREQTYKRAESMDEEKSKRLRELEAECKTRAIELKDLAAQKAAVEMQLQKNIIENKSVTESHAAGRRELELRLQKQTVEGKAASDDRDAARRELKLGLDKNAAEIEAKLQRANTEAKIAQHAALAEQDRLNQLAAKASLDRIMELTTRERDLRTRLELADKNVADWKAMADRAAATPRKMNAATQGTLAENEVAEFLTSALGPFMEVRNVSKIGQGSELDLELISRDELVHIRLDVKSHTSTNFLPESEMARFYRDVDTQKPSAAILFMRPALRSTNPQENTLQRQRRGNTLVFLIGNWSLGLLIECIHEAVLEARIRMADAQNALRPFPGAAEINAAFAEVLAVIGNDNDATNEVFTTMRKWIAERAAKLRIVAEKARNAHSINPTALSKSVFDKFESHLPKQLRGRPPAVTSEDKKETKTENTKSNDVKAAKPTAAKPTQKRKAVDVAAPEGKSKRRKQNVSKAPEPPLPVHTGRAQLFSSEELAAPKPPEKATSPSKPSLIITLEQKSS